MRIIVSGKLERGRNGPRLTETMEITNFWGRYVLDKEFYDPAGWEIQNMLTAAYLVNECALLDQRLHEG